MAMTVQRQFASAVTEIYQDALEAMLQPLLAFTPATACHIDGSSPLGTDNCVMVVKDEHDRILIPHEAASEHGEEARKFLQHVKDLGLHVTAAFSDYFSRFTEALKAVWPQARLQADHCHTVKHILPGAGRAALPPAAPGRHGAPPRRWHPRARRDAQASLARPRRPPHRRDRAGHRNVSRPLGSPDTARSSPGTAPVDATSREGSGRDGLELLDAARTSVPRGECHDTSDGHRDHRPVRECARTVVVSRAAASVDATQAPWASLTGAQTPERAVVRGPR